MSVSLPSKLVHSIDVPEVRGFSAKFVYNFYVSDETVNEENPIPVRLRRSTNAVDESYVKNIESKVPRLVTFSFAPTVIRNDSSFAPDASSETRVFNNIRQRGMLEKNIDKVVTEDQFSSYDFLGLTFHNGSIGDDLHEVFTRSYDLRNKQRKSPTSQTVKQMGDKYGQLVSNDLVVNAVQSPESKGARFFRADGQGIYDTYFKDMSAVLTSAQISTRFLPKLVDSLESLGTSTNSDSIRAAASNAVSNNARKPNELDESEFKVFVPYIAIRTQNSGIVDKPRAPQCVGYIIDKYEITSSGGVIPKRPIVIEGQNVSFTIDSRVKYGTRYAYSIRSVVLFTLPATDIETGESVLMDVLISSKPTAQVFIDTIDLVAPPPPVDLSFTWNRTMLNPIARTSGVMMIHWSFPVNAQRDIKRFQVFRRASVKEPFELIREIDFDDAITRVENEYIPDDLREVRYNFVQADEKAPSGIKSNPIAFYFDEEFMVGKQLDAVPQQDAINHSSKFIYAVVSIDAHGLTSNYSAQFEVSFDVFKNKIQKTLISHSGAPKAYPNLYLHKDTFVDTMRVSGKLAQTARLYFSPEFYTYVDKSMKVTPAFLMNDGQDVNCYKLNFVNVDRQFSRTLTIKIKDDTITSDKTKTVKTATKTFNR